jgi:hypothetical protein
VGLVMVTGFGNLPLLPRLYLRPHDIVISYVVVVQ